MPEGQVRLNFSEITPILLVTYLSYVEKPHNSNTFQVSSPHFFRSAQVWTRRVNERSTSGL